MNFTDPSGMLPLTGEAAQNFFGWLKNNLHAGIDRMDKMASFYAGVDGGGYLSGGDAYDTWHSMGGVKSGIIPISNGSKNCAYQSRQYWIDHFKKFSFLGYQPILQTNIGEATPKSEGDKYGNVLGGVNLSGTLALGGGGAAELGYVVTDKGYRQNYITLYTAATISASASYSIFTVKSTSSNGVSIGDWAGRCTEAGGFYMFFGFQFGGNEAASYTTKTYSFGYGVTYPEKLSGGAFSGNTYLLGNPIPFTNPGTLDPAGSYWYYRINGLFP